MAEVGKAAAANEGYRPEDYNTTAFVVFNCFQGGLASGKDAWFNIPWGGKDKTAVHEIGHTFGLAHANALECWDNPERNNNRVPFSNYCTLKEYLDFSDPMGFSMRHFNTYHKDKLGWFNPGNTLDIITNGTYLVDLKPLEFFGTEKKYYDWENYLRVVRVPFLWRWNPNLVVDKWWTVDYRQPFGIFDDYAVDDLLTKGVFIKLAPSSVGSSLIVDNDINNQIDDWRNPTLKPPREFHDHHLGTRIQALGPVVEEKKGDVKLESSPPFRVKIDFIADITPPTVISVTPADNSAISRRFPANISITAEDPSVRFNKYGFILMIISLTQNSAGLVLLPVPSPVLIIGT